MRLAELEPQFLRHEYRDGSEYHVFVDSLGEADGIMFLCPVCWTANKGPIGTHQVICWRPRIAPDIHPKPGRWELIGSSYADLSLVAGSSSVLLTSGCNAHFFVRSGQIEVC